MPFKDKTKARDYQRSYMRNWLETNPEQRKKARERTKSYRTQLREEIIMLLGAKCVRCGFSADIRALQIDHVKGGGRQEIKRFGGARNPYYRFIRDQIKAGSKDYQCLCANCNAIKH